MTERPPPQGERFPEASGPMTDVQATGTRLPVIGPVPRQLPWEMVLKERDQAARRYELRQQVERAALQAGLTALQAAEAADRLQREAASAADKAVKSL